MEAVQLSTVSAAPQAALPGSVIAALPSGTQANDLFTSLLENNSLQWQQASLKALPSSTVDNSADNFAETDKTAQSDISRAGQLDAQQDALMLAATLQASLVMPMSILPQKDAQTTSSLNESLMDVDSLKPIGGNIDAGQIADASASLSAGIGLAALNEQVGVADSKMPEATDTSMKMDTLSNKASTDVDSKLTGTADKTMTMDTLSNKVFTDVDSKLPGTAYTTSKVDAMGKKVAAPAEEIETKSQLEGLSVDSSEKQTADYSLVSDSLEPGLPDPGNEVSASALEGSSLSRKDIGFNQPQVLKVQANPKAQVENPQTSVETKNISSMEDKSVKAENPVNAKNSLSNQQDNDGINSKFEGVTLHKTVVNHPVNDRFAARHDAGMMFSDEQGGTGFQQRFSDAGNSEMSGDSALKFGKSQDVSSVEDNFTEFQDAGKFSEASFKHDPMNLLHAVAHGNPKTESASGTDPVQIQSTSQNIMRQVTDKISTHEFNAGDQRISLQLSPEHLGNLQLNVSMQEKGIRLEIVAEHRGVRDALMQQADELKESLARQNIKMDSFSVTTGSGGSMARDQQEWKQASAEVANQQRQNIAQRSPYRASEPGSSIGVRYFAPQYQSTIDVRF